MFADLHVIFTSEQCTTAGEHLADHTATIVAASFVHSHVGYLQFQENQTRKN